MARFLVERTFPAGLAIPTNEQGANTCLTVVGNNALDGVTWVHSYVTNDKNKTFCIYDAPSEQAIRPRPSATDCRSTASPRCACWIHTFTSKPTFEKDSSKREITMNRKTLIIALSIRQPGCPDRHGRSGRRPIGPDQKFGRLRPNINASKSPRQRIRCSCLAWTTASTTPA
jgi:hypothetical protein